MTMLPTPGDLCRADSDRLTYDFQEGGKVITISDGHCREGVSDVVGRLGCKLKLVVHPPTVSRSLQTTALVKW